MLWCMWAAKGGSGCSVMAAAAAVLTARVGPTLIVDLAGGDQATILGVEPRGRGLRHWLGHPNPPPDSLARLEVPVIDGLQLLPCQGARRPADEPVPVDRVALLAGLLADDVRTVIVDLGVLSERDQADERSPGRSVAPFLAAADRSTVVTRLCYLGLSLALERPVPDDVIVVSEPDRALRPADVGAALRAPTTTVRWDPAVARAVDTGLLTRRLPRALLRLPVETGDTARSRT